MHFWCCYGCTLLKQDSGRVELPQNERFPGRGRKREAPAAVAAVGPSPREGRVRALRRYWEARLPTKYSRHVNLIGIDLAPQINPYQIRID